MPDDQRSLSARGIRCGGCGAVTAWDEMPAHIAGCDGWISYEGHELADLARETGFEPVHYKPSWFERVVLRRKERYEI